MKQQQLLKKHSMVTNYKIFPTNNIKRRLSSSNKASSIPRTTNQSFDISSNTGQIYFDTQKKSNYMKKIVDTYFQNKFINYRQQRMPTINNKFIKYQPDFNQKQIKINHIGRQLSHSVDIFKQKSQLNTVQHSNNSYPPPRLLPPIHQVDDKQDYLLDPVDDNNYSTLSQLQIVPQKQSKVLTFQNQVFMVFIVFSAGKPKYRLKEYKNLGLQILKRQQRLRKYQITQIWKQSQFNPNCLMSSMSPPIKDILSRTSTEWQNKNIVYKIHPRNYHRHLLGKNNYELINFIKDICSLLKKVQGKVLNNKINPSNIFLIDGKPCLAQWGHSAFRQQFNIQSNTFESRIEPVLRSQQQWFVTPQYLSPQFLHQIISQKPYDLWEYPSSSDIWSLGCTIFEILTLIPLWTPVKCYVKDKAKCVRSGLLGVEGRNLQRLYEKQLKFPKIVKRCLGNELLVEQSNQIIINLVLRMLQIDPGERITFDEILEALK